MHPHPKKLIMCNAGDFDYGNFVMGVFVEDYFEGDSVLHLWAAQNCSRPTGLNNIPFAAYEGLGMYI
jgi:hypothetical protein